MKKQQEPKLYKATCSDCGKIISSLSKNQFDWNCKLHTMACSKKLNEEEEDKD